jgi:ABC-type cobalt transport system substrate-binding protein
MKFKVRSLGFGARGFLIFILLFTLHLSLSTAGEKWSGVDESVVEKYAKEHGREAREPLINPNQGDLLLFVFLLAGTVGGFFGGYYWRMLVAEKAPKIEQQKSSA